MIQEMAKSEAASARQPPPARSGRLPLVLHTRVVTGQGGGPEKTILNSPRYLHGLGYRSMCAYMRGHGDVEFEKIRRKAEDRAAPLLEVDDCGPFDLSVFKRYLEICRAEQVSVWHSHDYKSNLIGLWVNRYWPMKLVTTAHGWAESTWRTPFYYAVDRWCQKRFDRVICVSDDLHAACLRNGVQSGKCVVIQNAIDAVEFRRKRGIPDAKKQLGFAIDRPLVGAVGRLAAEKGFDILIRAFAESLKTGCSYDLAIAGEGNERVRLESLARQLGVSDRVRFLGYRADTRTLYEAFDIFVLSSHREGLPNVVLEAMAMETPVIATNIAGVAKVIVHDQEGVLVEPGHVHSLAAALSKLLSDDALRERLSNSARQTIEQRFSFQRRMEKVAKIYDEVLERRS